MEWTGCGIFGKLWRYFTPRKSATPRELNDPDCSISSLGDIESTINTFKIEEPDSTLFDSVNPELTRSAEDIHTKETSEVNHSTDILISDQTRQRPHSAHIPFRPVLLFEEGPVTEEVRGATRYNLNDQEKSLQISTKSIQRPVLKIEGTKAHAVACKRLANIVTSVEVQPSLDLTSPLDRDGMDAVTATMGSDNINYTKSLQCLTRKLEHFALPRRSDEILHAIEDNLTDRTDQSKGDTNSFEKYSYHSARMRHAYPYFMPESAYVKLKQEERWRELRRELRLELETQVDCELLQRVRRIRKPYQLPLLPQTTESLEIVRLLTIPPNLSTLIRMGVTCKSKMKTSLQFPTVRPTQNAASGVSGTPRRRGTHGKHRRARRIRTETLNKKQVLISARPLSSSNASKTQVTHHQFERPRTAEERPASATETIELYKAAANFMYNYPSHVPNKNELSIWTWRGSYKTDENEDVTNGSDLYKDVLDDLLVRIDQGRKKRDLNRGRKRLVSNAHEHGDEPAKVDLVEHKAISLIKVILEDVDWREGLLAQGVCLYADPDTNDEGFFCQLVSLERLQLLTRLEESEVIAVNPEEDLVAIRQYRMKHGKRLKHSQSKGVNALCAKVHNLPPLHPITSKRKVTKTETSNRVPWNSHRSKFPSIASSSFGSSYLEDSPHTRNAALCIKHNSCKRTSKIAPINSPETRIPINSPDSSNECPSLLSLPSLETNKLPCQWKPSIRTTSAHQWKAHEMVEESPGPRKATRVKWSTVDTRESPSTTTPIMESQLRRDRKKRSRRAASSGS